MDGNRSSCIRILGLLLLVLIFTMQAQAAFPQKQKTDITSALNQARAEMKVVISTYEHEHKFDLGEELAEAKAETQDTVQNDIPSCNLMAANRGK